MSFYAQLKSVESIEKHLLKEGDISYPFEVRDLEHWSVQAVPVILVIWDVGKTQGWWLWINDAIEFLQRTNPDWAHSQTVNVHIPFKNQLNDGALVGIRHRLADLYYPIISKDKVLTIDASFSFPQTPEGKTKLEELKRHFAAGEEVEIDGKYIKLFDFPDWWKRLYGEFEPTGMYLKLGPTRSKTARPAQIEFISEGQSEKIPYVELWTIKQGDEEITLTNDQQNIPIRFLVVLNRAMHQCEMQISTNTVDLDAPRALQILKMQKILADGGRIGLTFLDSGQGINLPVPPSSLSAPAKMVLEFAEKLNLIQSKLGITIRWPGDDEFSHKDYQAAEELVSVIEKGIYEQSGMILTVELRKPGIAKLLESHIEGTPMHFQLSTDQSYVEILSQRIELGPMIQKMRGFWRMPLEEVRSWFEKAQEDDAMVVRFEEVELHEEFETWLKK